MFGKLDQTIFPNECEVLEIAPQQRYVYPIFKNGSRSLYHSNFPIVDVNFLPHIKNIEIFVRDPHERFLSGVNTYLSKLDYNIDRNTMLFCISNTSFIDRHFCPQLYWLINLQRFTSATLTIRPLSELSTLTDLTLNSSTIDPDISSYFLNNEKIKFYNEIDEVLTVNLIGKTVTFDQIIWELKNKYSESYNETFAIIKNILSIVT